MKQLTCEMCGSTDLVKQDGFFVCQACGTKYSVEEAKKMMIEGTVEVQGTVKIDTKGHIEEWLKIGYDKLKGCSKGTDENKRFCCDSAEEYFDKVLDLEPDNADAHLGKILAAYTISSVKELLKSWDMEIKGEAFYAIMNSENIKVKNVVCQVNYQNAIRMMASGACYEGKDGTALYGVPSGTPCEPDEDASCNEVYRYDEAIYFYDAAIESFELISDYEDSKERISECIALRKECESKLRQAEEVEERIRQEKEAEKRRIREEKEKEERRIRQEKEAKRMAGVCQYCGGKFKGFFTKTCSSCGKQKDY